MKFRGAISTNGFTLIELLVVMAIFMIILMISASAFESVMKLNSNITKSVQTQTEGVVGLEIIRKDLNAAGYGLPWSFQTPPDRSTYLEADLGADNPVKGLSADDFNDAPPNSTATTPVISVPRSVLLGTVPATRDPIIKATGSNSNPGSDYLVIKSASAAFNNSVGKWGYVNYTGNTTVNSSYIAKWNSSEDLAANDVVVTHTNTFSGTNQAQHALAMKDAANYSYMLGTQDAAGRFVPPDANYMPTGSIVDPYGARINNEKVVTYAIRSFAAGTTNQIRMPFNRADYFVRRPASAIPARCNPGTGILYKAVINNSLNDVTINSNTYINGKQTLYPLLDCVGDMQVLFDMQDPTDVNKTMTADTLAGLTADDIRARLKTIRVYLLVQEGGKDTTYSYPFSDPNNVIRISDERTANMGRTFNETDMKNFFGDDWRNYRWKVYSVVGQPYNLMY